MLWIGLTGGLASGKSTVSGIFKEMGIPVVDADSLAHRALEVKKDSILKVFGPGILNPRGKVDRSLLGKKVFSDKKLRRSLEAIVHPYVREKAMEKRNLLESLGHKMAVYNVPLLFENHLEDHFDHILVVYVPEALLFKRLMARDGLDKGEAGRRIRSQMDIEEKKRKADSLISNQGDKKELRKKIRKFLCDFDPCL